MGDRVKSCAIIFGVPLLLLLAASIWSVHDDRQGLLSLELLSAPITQLIRLGNEWLASRFSTDSWYIGGSAILFGILLLGSGFAGNWLRTASGMAAALFACAAHLALLRQENSMAAAFVTCAVACVLGFAFCSAKSESVLPEPESKPPAGGEIITYVAIVSLAVILRFYALNQHLSYFEGELSPYSAAATSPAGSLQANVGYWGPWAPLGLLYYPPIFATTSVWGTTVLALRISSAWVGVLAIPLLYVLMRRMAGSAAALIAIAFFALDPLHIGWDRTDIHPHGATTWPTVLLGLATYGMLKWRRHRDFALVALLMGLVWHQYPSGQSAVALPCMVFVLGCLLDKGFLRACWAKSLWLVCGFGLWFVGLPVTIYLGTGEWHFPNPFTTMSVRSTWGNLPADADELDTIQFLISYWLINARHFIEAVYIRALELHPQDIIPNVQGISLRTVPWAVAALGGAAATLLLLQLRRPQAKILLSWMAVAALPTILSHSPFPKRASTFYPALGCAAAYLLGEIVRGLNPRSRFTRLGLVCYAGATFVIGLSVVAASWFDTQRWAYGPPDEIAVTDYITQQTIPGTIIILEADEAYMMNKFTYLVIERLTSTEHRPNAWIPFDTRVHSWEKVLPQPELIVESLHTPNWIYRWTKFRDQLAESATPRGWARIVYVVQERPQEGALNNLPLLERIRSSCRNPVEKRFTRVHHLTHAVTVFTCTSL